MIISALLRGGLLALAPNEALCRELWKSIERASSADGERLVAALPPGLGREPVDTPDAEIVALARTSWENLAASERDALRASAMLVLAETDPARNLAIATPLCVRLIHSLSRERPLSEWIARASGPRPSLATSDQATLGPRPELDEIECPACAERIKARAKVCRFCGLQLDPGPGAPTIAPRPPLVATAPGAPPAEWSAAATFRAPLSSLGVEPGALATARPSSPASSPAAAGRPAVTPAAPLHNAAGSRLRLSLKSENGETQQIDLDGLRPFRVGRDASSDLCLNDPKLSRHHFRFEFPSDGSVLLCEESSRNGVLVDGSLVSGQVALKDGSTIVAGGHEFQLAIISGMDLNRTIPAPLVVPVPGGRAGEKTTIAPDVPVVPYVPMTPSAPAAETPFQPDGLTLVQPVARDRVVAGAPVASPPPSAPPPTRLDPLAPPTRSLTWKGRPVGAVAPATPPPPVSGAGPSVTLPPGADAPTLAPLPATVRAPTFTPPPSVDMAPTIAPQRVSAPSPAPAPADTTSAPVAGPAGRSPALKIALASVLTLILAGGLAFVFARERVVGFVSSLFLKGLDVRTTPPGAKVIVDDREASAPTPVFLEGVPPGKHKLMLRLEGYRESVADVDLAAGGYLAVAVELVPFQGTLVIETTGDAPAAISIASDAGEPERTGETDKGILKLASIRARPYHVKATRKGFEPATADVTVVPDSETHVKLDLQEHRGTLSVRSTPAGLAATLDGVPFGTTPIEKDVPPGPHEVVVTGTKGAAATAKVQVRGDEPSVCVLDLETLEKALEAIAWTRGDVPPDRLATALQQLHAFADQWGTGGAAASWIAGRVSQLEADKAWAEFSAALASAASVDDKIALCEAFLKAHPDHPRAAEVRKLGAAPDETRGWFKEPLPPHLRRQDERPLYVWNNGKGADIELVYVPAGNFTMGSDQSNLEKPKHDHPVPYGYWIGRYEVTWAQYLAFCKGSGRKPPEAPAWGRGDALPVTNVTWNDANAFCVWEGLVLPNEVEWEKAARGADERKFPWGPTTPNDRLCVFGQDVAKGTPQAVGSCKEGVAPCGALDMAGNVAEWCNNFYDDGLYALWAKGQLEFPKAGSAKLVRGGSYKSSAERCRSTYRTWFAPSQSFGDVGFRVALVAGGP